MSSNRGSLPVKEARMEAVEARLLAIKRSGAVEPFAAGRIALAVFRAARGLKPAMEGALARSVGAKVGNRVWQLASALPVDANGEQRLEIEWIQDKAIQALRELGEPKLAASYSAYRESRSQARKSKPAPVAVVRLKDAKFSREQWEGICEALLARHALALSVSQWHQACPDLNSKSSLVEFLEGAAQGLLAVCGSHPSFLPAINEIYFSAWCQEAMQICPIFDGWESSQAKARERCREALAGLKKRGHCLLALKDLVALTQKVDLRQDATMLTSGQQLLRERLPKGALPSIAFCMAAAHLGRTIEESQALYQGLSQRWLLLSAQALASLWEAPGFAFERGSKVEDRTESIFEALGQCAKWAKDGCSISVNLARLRSESVPVGGRGNMSSGIGPVMRLFAETCGMLSGVEGEAQKARLYLEPWHADLETFLAFGREARGAIRTGLLLPDTFMKRVIDGEDWVLGSPTDLPRLLNAKSSQERELAIADYCKLAKAGVLEHSRALPAREVFGWITSAIAAGRGPSIAFQDTLRRFDGGASDALPSARMGSLLSCAPDDEVREAAVALHEGLSEEDIAARMNLAANLFARYESAPGAEANMALCVVGSVDQGVFLKALSTHFNAVGKVWPKACYWGNAQPWEARKKDLAASRGGYLERGEKLAWSAKQGAPFGRYLAQTPREDYLWVSASAPIWTHGAYRFQVRIGANRCSFGRKEAALSPQEQIRRVAKWQAVTDQCLTFDLFLNQTDARGIGEIVKMGWLHGLSCMRRFVLPG